MVRNVQIILVESVEGRGHSEDLGVDDKIMLQWISEKMWNN